MAGKGFGGMKPKVGNRDSLRLEEVVELFKFPDKKWVQLRFLDKVDPLHVKQHWIKILGGKDKREIKIPRYCLSHNPADPDTPRDIVCPYCDISSGKDGAMSTNEFFLVNAIVREIQEEEPARKPKPTAEETKTGFKDIRSKTWTPVRVVRLTSSLVSRIQEISENNKHKNKKLNEVRQYDATDPRYGFDVSIKYKSDGAGTDKYSCDKVEGGATPLTAEEQDYLVWRLDESLLDETGRMSAKQALDDFKRMEIVGDIPEDDDEDDDDVPRRKKSATKSRSLDDDDDDDTPPRKKKRPVDDDDDEDTPPRKKKRPFDDDDDDDETPPRKKKRPVDDDDDEDTPPRKKKRPAVSDDDDDDDTPPRRKKRPVDDDEDTTPRKKKRPAVSDDDDDDGATTPRKKTSASGATTAKKKSTSRGIDDDDDAPPRKKKRPVDDDEPVRKKRRSRSALDD